MSEQRVPFREVLLRLRDFGLLTDEELDLAIATPGAGAQLRGWFDRVQTGSLSRSRFDAFKAELLGTADPS